MTCAQFMASLINEERSENIQQKTAAFLRLKENSDLLKKLKWLGFFSEQTLNLSRGSNADVLIALMTQKMSYAPHEKDMVIVHTEILARFPDRKEKQISTLLVKGEVGGDSAMSRAVSLPAAIASRLILENKIKARGVQRPTLKEIYLPVLAEMDHLGYPFKNKTLNLNPAQADSTDD